MKKTVYFIRHGESEGNKNRIAQSITTPLSDLGIEQAYQAKSYINKLNIDTYITSNMTRAKHTGEIVFFDALSGEVGKIQENDLFREYGMPTSIQGLSADSEEYKQVLKFWEDHKYDDTVIFEDEESSSIFRKRLVDAATFLEKVAGQTVAVVTHGYFLRNLLAFILLDGKGSIQEIEEVVERLSTVNTGISKVVYDDSKTESAWKIYSFNDHSHLLDVKEGGVGS